MNCSKLCVCFHKIVVKIVDAPYIMVSLIIGKLYFFSSFFQTGKGIYRLLFLCFLSGCIVILELN